MAEYNDDDLYDLSDEDLEAAFKEAKTAESTTDDTVEDVDTDEDLNEELDDNSDDEIEEDFEEEFEEEEDGSEQPEEDSDHDTSDEDEDEEDLEEETDESDEDTLDGETDEDEDGTAEESDETESKTQEAQKLKFKANGQEYDFSEQEIKDQFPRIFGQAMDYTKKMQAIKPYRKTIDAIEQANLKHEDINLMIDVLKGDKDAVAEVLKRTGVDALDLDSESSNYIAKDYGRDESALELADVISDIDKDAEYATTSSIIGKQWDEDSWNEMSKNPKLIKQLHVDVQSGMYDTIAPIMNKMKVFDGGNRSDLEYYKEAAKSYFNTKRIEEQTQKQSEESDRLSGLKEEERLEEVKKQESKRKATRKASSKRKAAAPTRSKAAPSKVIDYLDDDDEKFDEWYDSLQKNI